jgi:hypothetical protein
MLQGGVLYMGNANVQTSMTIDSIRDLRRVLSCSPVPSLLEGGAAQKLGSCVPMKFNCATSSTVSIFLTRFFLVLDMSHEFRSFTGLMWSNSQTFYTAARNHGGD